MESRKSSKDISSFDNILQMNWKKNECPNNAKKSVAVSPTPSDNRKELRKYQINFLVHESFYDGWTPMKKKNDQEPYFRNVHPKDEEAIRFYLDPKNELAKIARCASSDMTVESSLDPNVPAFVPYPNDSQTSLEHKEVSVATTAPKRRPGIRLNRKPIIESCDKDEPAPAPPSNIMYSNPKTDIDKLLDHLDAVRLNMNGLAKYETENPDPLATMLMNNMKESDQESDVQGVRFTPTDVDTRAKDVCFPSSAMSTIPTAMVQPSIMTMARSILSEREIDFDSNIPFNSTSTSYSVSEVQQNQVPQPYSMLDKNPLLTLEQNGQSFGQSPSVIRSDFESHNRYQPSLYSDTTHPMKTMDSNPSYQQPSLVSQFASEAHSLRQQQHFTSDQNPMYSEKSDQFVRQTSLVGRSPFESQNFLQQSLSDTYPVKSENNLSYPQTPLVGQSAPEPSNLRPHTSNQNPMYSVGNNESCRQPPLFGGSTFDSQNSRRQSLNYNTDLMISVEENHSYRPTSLGGQFVSKISNHGQSSTNRMCFMENDQSYQQSPVIQLPSGLRNHGQASNFFTTQKYPIESDQSYQQPTSVSQLPPAVRNHGQAPSLPITHHQMYPIENDQSNQQSTAVSQLPPGLRNHRQASSIPNTHNQMYGIENDQSYQQQLLGNQFASEMQNRPQSLPACNPNLMSGMGQDIPFQQPSQGCQLPSQQRNHSESASIASQMLMMGQDHFGKPPPCLPAAQPSVSPTQDPIPSSAYHSSQMPRVSMPINVNGNTRSNERYRRRTDTVMENGSDNPITIAQLRKIIDESNGISQEQCHEPQISPSQWNFPQLGNNEQLMPEQNLCGVSFSSDL